MSMTCPRMRFHLVQNLVDAPCEHLGLKGWGRDYRPSGGIVGIIEQDLQAKADGDA